MSWARLDDGFPDHPRVKPLSDKAFRAHVTALCYVARYRTNGHVPMELATPATARELATNGIWMPDTDGWRIRDWRDYNSTREEFEARQESERERQRRRRRGGDGRYEVDPDAP